MGIKPIFTHTWLLFHLQAKGAVLLKQADSAIAWGWHPMALGQLSVI